MPPQKSLCSTRTATSPNRLPRARPRNALVSASSICIRRGVAPNERPRSGGDGGDATDRTSMAWSRVGSSLGGDRELPTGGQNQKRMPMEGKNEMPDARRVR